MDVGVGEAGATAGAGTAEDVAITRGVAGTVDEADGKADEPPAEADEPPESGGPATEPSRRSPGPFGYSGAAAGAP